MYINIAVKPAYNLYRILTKRFGECVSLSDYSLKMQIQDFHSQNFS